MENKQNVGNGDINATMRDLVARFSSASNEIQIAYELWKGGLLDSVESFQKAFEEIKKHAKIGEKDLRDYLKTTYKLSDEISSNYSKILGYTRDELDVLRKITVEEEQRWDRGKETLSISEKLADFIHDQYVASKKYSLSEENIVNLLTKKVKGQGQFNDVLSIESDLVADLNAQASDVTNMIEGLGSKTFSVNGKLDLTSDQAIKEIAKIQSQLNSRLSDFSKDFDATILSDLALANSAFQKDASGKLQSKKTKKTLSGREEQLANEEIDKRLKLYRELSTLKTKDELLSSLAYQNMHANEKVAIKLVRETQMQVAFEKEKLKLSDLNLRRALKYKPALQAASSAGEELVSKVSELASVLPTGLRKILQIDQSLVGVTKANEEALKRFSKEMANGKTVSQALRSSVTDWTSGIMKSVGAVGILAIGFAAILKTTTFLVEKYRNTAKSLGISFHSAKALYQINQKTVASSKNQYTTMESLVELQKEYLNATGMVDDLKSDKTQKTLKSLDLISSAFGITSDVAVEALETFMKLGSSQAEAVDILKNVSATAEKNGFSAMTISKDLVENSEMVATYFGGMSENAAKAAMSARKMGMNLKQVGTVIDRTLNLEGFMTDMYELSAMGGPDLSKVFEAGVTGDVTKTAKELMDALGGIEQFNTMEPLQKKKIASTLGLTVDELSKSMMLEKKIAGLSGKTAEYVREHLDSFTDLVNISEKDVAAKQEEEGIMKRMSAGWEKIKMTFVRSLLPAVEGFVKLLEQGSPAIDAIVWGFGALAEVVRGIAIVFSGIMHPIDTISGWFSSSTGNAKNVAASMASVGGSISDVSSGMEPVVDGMNKWVSYGGKVVGFFLSYKLILKPIGSMIGSIASSLFGVSKAALESKGVLSTLGDSVSNVFKKTPTTGGVFDTIKDKILNVGGLFDKLKSKFDVKGMLAKVPGVGRMFKPESQPSAGGASSQATDSVSGKVGSNLDGLRKSMKNIVGVVTDTVDSVGKLFVKLSSSIRGVFKNIVGIVSDVISIISSGIGKGIQSILSGIGKGLNTFTGKAVVGAAAIAILSGSVWVLSKALQNMASVSGDDLLKLGAVIVGLGTAVGVLGAVMSTGVGAAAIVAGTLALAGMGAALIPLATALRIASPALESLGNIIGKAFVGISGVITSVGSAISGMFSTLSDMSPLHLFGLAGAIGALSVSLASFGAGSALSGIGSFIGKAFGGDSLGKMQKMSELANPLQIVANSLASMGDSLKEVAEQIGKLDVSKLTKIASGLSGGSVMFSSPGTMYQKPIPASANIPPAQMTAQNISMSNAVSRKTVDENKKDPDVYNIASQSGAQNSTRTNAILQQIYQAIVQNNSRPLVFQFDDGTLKYLSSRTKAFNNNRG